MRAASDELIGLFSTDQAFEQFDLYTVTLRSGLVLRYTNCNFDVVVGAATFLCSRSDGGIVIDEAENGGPRAEWTDNLDTGKWSVVVMLRETDRIGVHSWINAIRAGLFDEATVRVDRGYIRSWPSSGLSLAPIGTINVFAGRIAEVDFDRTACTLQMNDFRELLDVDMPRNLYSAACRYALFDGACGLAKDDFAIDATVSGVVGNQIVAVVTEETIEADYLALGEIAFTTGNNAGLTVMIKAWSVLGVAELLTPMPFEIINGDAVRLFPGCDKKSATCDNKFGNLDKYGGFPFIPAPETSF